MSKTAPLFSRFPALTVGGTAWYSIGVPTRTGYTFQYWRGSEYEAGADYTVTGDHTFTAVWEKTPSKKKESTPSKTILPRTGDDFNASVPFAIGLMGALLIGAGYVMRRRNQHINR